MLEDNARRCYTVMELSAGMGPIRDRETVGKLCTELSAPDAGYLDRPHGVKRGTR